MKRQKQKREKLFLLSCASKIRALLDYLENSFENFLYTRMKTTAAMISETIGRYESETVLPKKYPILMTPAAQMRDAVKNIKEVITVRS